MLKKGMRKMYKLLKDGRTKKIIATFLLVNLLSIDLIYAGNIIVGSGSTTIDKAANGVDLVNISNPNKNGVSHNDFEKYNVNEKGLVINNSTEVGRSELAGLVNNNPNLSNSAKIIIAEVSGSEKSSLNGYTEVFGQSADFILANPNGIYVNGAGFINTPRVTLTTGKSEGLESRLGFRVENGSIGIGEKGIDLSNTSYFEIISRTAKLNGNIYGKDEVRLIAGQNEYYYDNKEYKKLVGESTGKAEIGIDTSALGGIYAGRIALIGTEEGVGINSQSEIVADVSDVIIDANGNIVLKDVYANKNLNVKSTNNVDISKVNSNEGIDIDAKGIVEVGESIASKKVLINSENLINKGRVEGKESIKLTSQSMKNEGDILSEDIKVDSNLVENNGKIIGNKYLKVESEKFVNNGIIQSNKLIELIGENLVNNKDINSQDFTYIDIDFIENNGLITGNKRVVVEGVIELKNFNEISSNEYLEIKAQELDNNGNIVSIGSFNIQVSKVLLDGVMQTVDGKIKVDKLLISESGYILTDTGEIIARVIIENSGEVKGKVSLLLEGLTLDNKGIITGDKLVRLDMANILNTGRVQSKDKLLIEAHDLNNKGTIISENETNLNSNTISNEGLVTGNKSVIVESLVSLVNKDEISSNGTLIIKAPRVDSSGKIVALGNYRVEANEISLSGGLGGELGEIEIDKLLISESGYIINENGSIIARLIIENKGEIRGRVSLGITALKLDNRGIISGDNLVRLDTNTLNNSNRIHSKGSLTIGAEEIFNSGTIVSDKTTNLEAKMMENEGIITAQEKVVIESLDRLINRGELSSKDTLVIKAPEIDSSGEIVGLKSYRIDSNNFNLSGALGGGLGEVEVDKLLISDTGYITTDTGQIIARALVENNGEVKGGKNLTIKSLNLVNKGIISGDKLVRIEGASLFNSGKIQSVQDLKIEVDEIENKGTIIANEETSIKGNNIYNKGVVTGNEKVIIEALTKLINNGELSSKGNLIVRAPELDNNGKIVGLGSYKIEVVNLDLKGVLGGGVGEIEVDTLLISETGYILTEEGSIVARIFVKNTGEIRGNKNLIIKSLSLENKGIITGDKLVRLEIENLFNTGKIEAKEDLEVEVTKIFENHNLITGSQKVIVEGIEKLVNTGEISSVNTLEIRAPKVDSSGKLIGLGSYLIDAEELIVSGLLGGNTGKVDVDNLLVSESGYISTRDALIIGRVFVENKGIIKGEEKLVIQSLSLDNQGIIAGNKLIRLDTPQLLNAGRIQSSTSVIIEAEKIDNKGTILSETETKLKATNIENSGVVSGSTDVIIESIATLINNGELSSSTNLTINAPEIDSSGKIVGLGTYVIQGDKLNLSGLLGGGNGDVDVNQLVISSTGYVLTKKGGILARVRVENSGEIKGEENLVITSLRLDNKGIITGDKLVRLELEELINTGKIDAKEVLNIKASKVFENNNLITGTAEVVVEGLTSLVNRGEISSASTLELKAPLIDSSGKIVGLGNYLVSAKELRVKGVLGGGTGEIEVDQLLISDTGYITTKEGNIIARVRVENSGEIQGEHNLVIESIEINNSGIITGNGLIRLKATKEINNSNRIQSKDRVELKAKLITNEKNGVIVANNTVNVEAIDINDIGLGNIYNSGIITSNVEVQLSAASDVINFGEISSDGKLSIEVPQINNEGLIYGGANYVIDTKELFNFGNIGGGDGRFIVDNLYIDKTGRIMTESGHIIAKLISVNGILKTNKDLVITSDKLINNNNILSLGMTNLGVKDLENNKYLQSKGNLSIKGNEKLLNNGLVYSGANIDISGINFDNRGSFTAEKLLALRGFTQINTQGELNSKGNMVLDTETIDIRGKVLSNNTLDISAKQYINVKGEISGSEVNMSTSTLNINKILDEKGDVVDRGLIKGSESIYINASDSIENHGYINGKNVTLESKRIINYQSSEIYAQLMAIIRSRQVENNSRIISNSTLKFEREVAVDLPHSLVNNGTIAGFDTIEIVDIDQINNSVLAMVYSKQTINIIRANNFINDGELNTVRDISIESNTFNNNSTISAGNAMNLKGVSLVNSGSIISNSNLTINSTNELVNKDTIKGKDISIDSSSVVNGDTSSTDVYIYGDNVTVKNAQIINNNGATIQGNNTLNIVDGKTIENKGNIVGGNELGISSTTLNNEGNIQSKGNINISASGNVDNKNGIILATGQEENGLVKKEGKVDITSENLNNTGQISGKDSVKLLARSNIDNDADILSNGSVEIVGNKLIDNSGRVLGDNISFVTTNGRIINTNEIKANLLVTLAGPSIENENILLSGGDLVIDGNFVNNGKVYQLNQNGKLVFKNGSLVNNEEIATLGNVDASLVTSVTNNSYVEDEVSKKASIKSEGGNISLNNLTNKGLVEAFGDVSISNESIVENSTGDIKSLAGTVKLEGSGLNNTGGRIESNNAVEIILTGDFATHGVIKGNELTKVEANNINIATELEAKKVEVVAKNRVTVNSKIAGKDNVNIFGANLDINNIVSSQMDMYLNIVSTINNKGAGRIVGGNGLTRVTGTTINNYTKISGLNDILLKATSTFNNFGQVAVGNILNIEGNNIYNKPNAVIYASNGMSIKYDGTLLNERASIISDGNMLIAGLNKEKSNQLVNKSGLIESKGNMTIKSEIVNNSFEKNYQIKEVEFLDGNVAIDASKINIVKLPLELGVGIKVDLSKYTGLGPDWNISVKFEIRNISKLNSELDKLYKIKVEEIKRKYPNVNIVFVGEYISDVNSQNRQSYKKEERYIDSKVETGTIDPKIKSQSNINIYGTTVQNTNGLISAKGNIVGEVNNFSNSGATYGYKLKTTNVILNSSHTERDEDDFRRRVTLQSGYITSEGVIGYTYYTSETRYEDGKYHSTNYSHDLKRTSTEGTVSNKNGFVSIGNGTVSAGGNITLNVAGGLKNKSYVGNSNIKEGTINTTQINLERIIESGKIDTGSNITIPEGEFGLFKINEDFVDKGLEKSTKELTVDNVAGEIIGEVIEITKNGGRIIESDIVIGDLGKINSAPDEVVQIGAIIDESLKKIDKSKVSEVIKDERVIDKSDTKLDMVEKSINLGDVESIVKEKYVTTSKEEIIEKDRKIDKTSKTLEQLDFKDIEQKERKSPKYNYMIETNVEFIDTSKYYGSSYFFERIDYNPEKDININLLGDSYYETKLVSDTIYKAIGQQYLFDDIHDDSEQMKKLFDNAVKVSEDMNLSIGIALSKEQIKNLKEDIIWLVEKEINGQLVLVPEVYLSKNTLEGLELRGSQIVAKENLVIEAKTVDNNGTISGGYVGIQADNINNITTGDVQAEISGGVVTLIAKNDIINTGAKIIGDKEINMKAGGDVVFDTIANVTESGSGNNYSKEVTHTLSEVSGGDITIISEGGDVKLIGTKMNASGNVGIQAENDVLLLAVKDSKLEKTETTESGFLKSKTTTTETYDETIHGSSINADGNIIISAGNNVGLVGSTIGINEVNFKTEDGEEVSAKLGGVSISAGNDVYAIEEREKDYSITKTEEKGFAVDWDKDSATLKVGVENNKKTEYNMTDKGSGSSIVGRDVVIDANGKVVLEGSDIKADNVAKVTGTKGIEIIESKDITVNKVKEENEFAGLTASVNSDILKVGDHLDKIKEVGEGLKGDRSDIINSISKGMDGVRGTADAINEAPDYSGKGVTNNETNNMKLDYDYKSQVSASIGAERTESNSSDYSEEVKGSSIQGGTVELSSEGEILVSGSDILGKDISINADKFTVKAAEENSNSQSRSENQNISLGVSLDETGVGLGDLTVGGGRDKSNSSSTTNINSTVNASGNLTINTKGDMVVSGGNVKADTVDMNIGGNLTVESLQDKEVSESDSKSGSLTVGMTGNVSGSFNTREDESNKAWVNNQSSIIAQNGGSIKVGNNTQLKGAVIASESSENKLALDTKTISTEDISDDEEGESKGFGVSGGVGSVPSTSIVYGNKDKEQINKATISGVDLTVDGEETSTEELGINSDLAKAQEVTKDEELKTIDANLHTDLANQEERDKLVDAGDKLNDVGNAIIDSGDGKGFTNTLKNNRFTTNGTRAVERDEELTKALNSLEGLSPEAQRDILQKVIDTYYEANGYDQQMAPTVTLYEGNSEEGFHDENNTDRVNEVFINVNTINEMLSGGGGVADAIALAVHETTHINQMSDKNEREEAGKNGINTSEENLAEHVEGRIEDKLDLDEDTFTEEELNDYLAGLKKENEEKGREQKDLAQGTEDANEVADEDKEKSSYQYEMEKEYVIKDFLQKNGLEPTPENLEKANAAAIMELGKKAAKGDELLEESTKLVSETYYKIEELKDLEPNSEEAIKIRGEIQALNEQLEINELKRLEKIVGDKDLALSLMSEGGEALLASSNPKLQAVGLALMFFEAVDDAGSALNAYLDRDYLTGTVYTGLVFMSGVEQLGIKTTLRSGTKVTFNPNTGLPEVNGMEVNRKALEADGKYIDYSDMTIKGRNDVIEIPKESAKDFEGRIYNLGTNERRAEILEKAKDVANERGWEKYKNSKDQKRIVYEDKNGNLYSVDTQHGRFEVLNKEGKHQGEVDMDLNKTKDADPSGGHDLRLKN